MDKKVILSWALIGLALLGVFDASYLTYEHFAHILPPCTVSAFADCGKVLQSQYAVIFGVPLALLGMIHYILEFSVVLMAIFAPKDLRLWRRILFLFSAVGLLVSLYLVTLQIFIIGAICQYCMVSAIDSLLIYIVARIRFKTEYKDFFRMKKLAALIFLYRPFEEAVTGKKHTAPKLHEKPTLTHLSHLENKIFQFMTRFLPREKVAEFLHEYQGKKH